MIKKVIISVFFILVMFLTVRPHFQMIIPSNNIIEKDDNKNIKLDIRFTHPMEGNMMNMDMPVRFGVKTNVGDLNLLKELKEVKIKNRRAYTLDYRIKRPGDYIFYIEPKPYWEPEEDCYIIHYTKVIVNGFGLEEGWDKPVGLKTEIIPLVRPYGLWTGNIFRGIVMLDSNPVAYAEIEVEYYNTGKPVKIPSSPFITQVIKTDKNGVFSYAMPKSGWWGFAALTQDSRKMKAPDGHEAGIEIGALIWVKTEDME